jgi:hypothetical protein
MPLQYPKSNGEFQLAACFSDQAVASFTSPSASGISARCVLHSALSAHPLDFAASGLMELRSTRKPMSEPR